MALSSASQIVLIKPLHSLELNVWVISKSQLTGSYTGQILNFLFNSSGYFQRRTKITWYMHQASIIVRTKKLSLTQDMSSCFQKYYILWRQPVHCFFTLGGVSSQLSGLPGEANETCRSEHPQDPWVLSHEANTNHLQLFSALDSSVLDQRQ